MKESILHKIFFILNKRDKKILVVIFFMMLLSAFLDLIGVSAILPIISLLNMNDGTGHFDPETSNTIIKLLSQITGITDIQTMSILLLVVLGIYYIVKTAYAFLTTYVFSKFTMSFSCPSPPK